MSERQLDGRMAGHVETLARWWTSATNEARYALLWRATRENSPPLEALHLAIYLAESAAGEIEEG